MVTEVDPAGLAEWHADAEPVLIVDVRTGVEFDLGHVPGSVNVPMTDLMDRIEDLEFPSRLVVVCEVGEVSAQAARLIEAYEGIGPEQTIANLAGGYRAWSAEMGQSVSRSE